MQDKPDAGSPAGAGFDCARTAAVIRAFVAGNDVRGERAGLRAHLASCTECRKYYRDFIETAARLTRAGRGATAETPREVDDSDDDRDDEPIVRRELAPPLVVRHKPTRWTRGLLVLFGLAACFALVRPDRASSHVRLEALSGDVRRGDVQVVAGAKALVVERATACSTGEGSRARLSSGASSVLLEPATALIVEDASSLRLHVFEGQVTVDGSAVIVTEHGAVEFDAAQGSLRSGAQGLAVHCEGGAVRVTDAGGVRQLAPGQHLDLAPAPDSRTESANSD
jgi:hypothetical protein